VGDDADADPTFHPYADADPDPTLYLMQIKILLFLYGSGSGQSGNLIDCLINYINLTKF
jgi:hypothetical protein